MSFSSSMANTQALPFQERVPLKNTLHRISDLLILFLLLSLLLYRLASLHSHGLVWLLAFICESWFTFVWVLYTNAKWSPVMYKTYPERLLKRFNDLPAVDMFVTTADPKLEPPIMTVNTVLSLLAVEYPAHKLACYVSDDGGSPITYYSLVEGSKFAKLWVPFCKKYKVQVRAPFVYFSTEPTAPQALSSDFMKDWIYMKNEYEELFRKVEDACMNHFPHVMDEELEVFSKIERGNHASIIKVIWENKEVSEDGVPHLIYVAREKRPKHPHHFKAGAMNVLTRVSGVITNAPFMLNVDCDMFANNPEVALHAMCLLLGFENEVYSGFVQSPQRFYGGLKDDPFGNQFVVLHDITGTGIVGIQGPFYAGTGCFHRRKVIYGSHPNTGDDTNNGGRYEDLSLIELRKVFGASKELMKSAAQITSAKRKEFSSSYSIPSRIEAAEQVAGCTYEFNTRWGEEIGWHYGSVTEDVQTSIRIHSMGWRSAYNNADPPAFLGNAPTGGPASLIQYKRWATGLLECVLGSNSPLLATLTKKLMFRQCLAYLIIHVWAPRSIFELCYALLPAYCLLANASFLPQASEPGFVVFATLFLTYNIYTLVEYLQCGLSIRAWWNNQRMQRIVVQTAYLMGFLTVFLKLIGISQTTFEVTKKDQPTNNTGTDTTEEDPGRFTFDSSPVFVPGVAVVILNLTAVGLSLVRLVKPAADGARAPGLGEFVCSVWILLSFWPFVRGLFGKGSYGIPWSTICKAVALVSILLAAVQMGHN